MKGPSSLWLVLSMSCAFIARLMVRGREPGFCPGRELPRIVQASLKELTEVDDVEPTVHFQNSVRTCYLSKNHSAVKLQKWEL